MLNTAALPLKFRNGHSMKNRFMLAPMTNQQSHEDGTLSEEEYRWLCMRAEGQFALVMTCASHVQEIGKGFSGQLGIWNDKHITGHRRLAEGIKSYGSLAVVQLHHAGMRSPAELIGNLPVCPSDNEKTGARALNMREVTQLRDDFISAAVRAKKAGYDGVEIHGAHGYILAQFLSSEINLRKDRYGGSLENRSRLIFEIINGVRLECGEEFLLGLRLSPERFGMKLNEVKELVKMLIDDAQLDFLDISLWDVFKDPVEEEYRDRSLLQHFTEINYEPTRLTVAGMIRSAKDVQKVLDAGVDFVSIGRSGILHHDFPIRVIDDPSFETIDTPVSRAYLHAEGLSDNFIDYMNRWPDFVKE
jgi:2,4-dienoyl-CoA reductase-like NADH-dependent reductase (Old Yellow Enzyme family)